MKVKTILINLKRQKYDTFFFSVSQMKLNLKWKKMETAEREKAPMLWYWSIPENGMDIEDCEKIAKENLVNRPNNRYMEMHIAFV